MIQADLFFEIWLSKIDMYTSIKGYSQKLLHDAYLEGLTPEDFYYKHVYLPF